MSKSDKNTPPPEAIRSTLVRRAGTTPNAKTVAEATLGTLHQLAAQLTPVIGARGVDALLTYSLHQTSHAFSWIEGDHEDTATLLASIKERLEAREAAEALEKRFDTEWHPQALRYVWKVEVPAVRAAADIALERLLLALEVYASPSLSFQVFVLDLRAAFGEG